MGAATSPGLWILLTSLTANAALGWAYLGQRDETAAAMVQRDQTRGDASACSDATEALRDLAAQRAKAAAPARAAASAARSSASIAPWACSPAMRATCAGECRRWATSD